MDCALLYHRGGVHAKRARTCILAKIAPDAERIPASRDFGYDPDCNSNIQVPIPWLTD